MSNPRDLWPLRHLIRVMRTHDNFWQLWQFLTTLTILTNFTISDNFDNPKDMWFLRHWLQFWQLWTWIHYNLCYLKIKSGTGQHLAILAFFLIYTFLRLHIQAGRAGIFLPYSSLKIWPNYQRLAQSSGEITEENLPGGFFGGGAIGGREDWFGLELTVLSLEAVNVFHARRASAHWPSQRDDAGGSESGECSFSLLRSINRNYIHQDFYASILFKIIIFSQKIKTLLVHKYGIWVFHFHIYSLYLILGFHVGIFQQHQNHIL